MARALAGSMPPSGSMQRVRSRNGLVCLRQRCFTTLPMAIYRFVPLVACGMRFVKERCSYATMNGINSPVEPDKHPESAHGLNPHVHLILDSPHVELLSAQSGAQRSALLAIAASCPPTPTRCHNSLGRQRRSIQTFQQSHGFEQDKTHQRQARLHS
jgi:hypothetical protein